MSIPESQLDTWSKQGSVAQSRDTYATIKGALEDATASYAGKEYSIFLQGSYGNDTNIYADSDVDVVMRLHSTFYHDAEKLPEDQKNAFNRAYSGAAYGLHEFKRDVVTQLTRKYGSSVRPGSKAVFIEGSGNRRDADVIVSAKYRRYQSFSDTNTEDYTEGICFLCRLCRYPGAAGELCISEIKRLKTHNCRITRNIDHHVTRFGDHSLSILARAFHAHGFIGSEQGARYFVR
jgi:hypothetical protein